MKHYEVEYTTNMDDRKTITMVGADTTDVYLKCVTAFPKHYIITNIRELRKGMKVFNLRSENGVHIVTIKGEAKRFLSLLNALNYINEESDECISI